MTGHWRCESCHADDAEIHLQAVGGGIKEARQVTCRGCGESDHYTLDLLSKENPLRTRQRKFHWVKGQKTQEGTMDLIPLEVLINVCRRQQLLLKIARYLALIGDEEQARELTQVEADLKTMEELRAGQGIQAV